MCSSDTLFFSGLQHVTRREDPRHRTGSGAGAPHHPDQQGQEIQGKIYFTYSGGHISVGKERFFPIFYDNVKILI